MRSVLKLFIRKIMNVKNILFELRGKNGPSLHNAEILRESIISADSSPKTFNSGAALLKDTLRD